MKGLIGIVLAAIALFACDACYPDPKYPPPENDPVIVMPDGAVHTVDAAAITQEDIACARITVIGCPEGQDPYCAEGMRESEVSKGGLATLECINKAQSKADLLRCGVRCVR